MNTFTAQELADFYQKAAVSNPEFESYYLGRVEAPKAKMTALRGE
jgi:hypothetical protein